ncbi:hypothetical protein L596_030492 [Steinernema carpocapsae]|uniref:procollagen-proline 4-dioxygenase n=1 Tax=Steinernema carpocapsae TaxID=34508 RepID=A0A4U5LPJ5_STECR|nr:hypothetical protein L596_030492 [Steinernema carpocapsae]
MRCALILSLFALRVSAHLFTSIADLQKLLIAERDIPNIVEQYISLEKHRISDLQKYVEKYEEINERLLKNGINEVTNPINAFRLIKEMSSTWKEVEHKMRNNNADFFIQNFTKNRTTAYPTAEDLTGAEDTYRLDTSELASGKIRNIQYSRPFTAHDCFEIARSAYNAEDYYHTILWMEEAKLLVEKEDPPTANMEDILEYLGFSLYKQDNLKHALKITEELYAMVPKHPRAKRNIKWYEEDVPHSEMRKNLPPVVNIRPDDKRNNTERDMYETLCRNEVPVSTKDTSKLYCYYKRDRPFLILAPFQVEILRFNPLAVLFKNVIYDKEIEIIQDLAKPKLSRATVFNPDQNEPTTASFRTSKSAWLKEWEHEVIGRITQRIDLMTNLDQTTAENLQIANYGIGGHYDPHVDFAHNDETKKFELSGNRNRICTVLFYMSEPIMGGATVFTEVKTTVMPSKNDALFWYNLYRSGEGDERTIHAACPVLVGDKVRPQTTLFCCNVHVF